MGKKELWFVILAICIIVYYMKHTICKCERENESISKIREINAIFCDKKFPIIYL